MSSYPPFYAYPSAPPVVRAVPDPPRLHWGWLLLLSVITLGFFGSVWMIVQANWVRKVRGHSKALPWTIVNASLLPAAFIAGFTIGIVVVMMHSQNLQSITASLNLFVRIAAFALWLVCVFTLSGELEAEPIDIPMSGGIVFFFGPIYFQYHLYDYEVPDEVHQFRGPLRTELEVRHDASSSEA
jgi:hypothetical protein